MIKTCKYCEKEIEFEKNNQFGAHLTNCKSNPSKIKRDLNSIKSKEYNLICKCGEKYTINISEYLFNKGNYKKFCSRKCANSRIFTQETKNKISNTLKGKIGVKKHKSIKNKKREILIKICEQCNDKYETKNIKQKFCSCSCSHKNLNKIQTKSNHYQKMGLKSVNLQNKRSKNEISFGEMCKNNFKNVKFNDPIFNGWDADIIIEDLKIAILWNGKWHYEKITKKHSIKQVQNRDKIKIEEIIKCGYIPYIIKDIGSFSEKKVKTEWEIFNIWLDNQKLFGIF